MHRHCQAKNSRRRKQSSYDIWVTSAVGHVFRWYVRGSKGAVGHDNVTFEGGFVIFVCQVPWTPGKVPSTPAVLRCPSARWIAPFSAGVAPFFPKSYAHLRMVTPFTEGVTPFADGLRSLPKDKSFLRPLTAQVRAQ